MARAFGAVWQTRRLLARVRAAASAARRPSGTRKPAPTAPLISSEDAIFLDAHSAAMAASMVGFFVCAFFSSIAYGWTFYYLLILAAAPRDILRERLRSVARRPVTAAPDLAPGTLPDLTARGVRA